MSNVFTSAGTTISITAQRPAAYTRAGFEALTGFKEIAEVVDGGEFGRTYNPVTHNSLSQRRTVKRKGSYNDGAMNCQLARVPSDEGQSILTEAVNSDASYSIRVVLQDRTTFYFSAQVMSYTTNIGTVDSITAATVNLEIDNDIIEVPPQSVTTVTVTPATLALEPAASSQLAVVVLPANAIQSVTWTSSDLAIASVNQDGLVTAVADGIATITATSTADNTKTDNCVVTVS